MDVLSAIKRARACRLYADRPVSTDDIEFVIDYARRTGSGHNRQPWTFIAITDQDDLETLSSFGEYTTPLRRAPVGLVLAVDRNEHERKDEHNVFDCGRAAQNLELGATVRGLGMVPQGIADRDAVAEFLDLPPSKRVLIGFALGYPAEVPDDSIEGVPKEKELESMGRRPIDDVLHWGEHR